MVMISCQSQLSITKERHDLHWKATFGVKDSARKDRKEIMRMNKLHIKERYKVIAENWRLRKE